jgi:spiro-SPASM protein
LSGLPALKIAFLLYVAETQTDEDLTFQDRYIPQSHSKLLGTLECFDGISVSLPGEYSGKLQNDDRALVREGQDGIEFWKSLFTGIDADHIIKIYADTPFLDITIIKEMIDLHVTSLAEYTYSENLPEGFTCECVSRNLVSSIPDSHDRTLSLGKIIKANINHFDIEIFYKDPDIRDKRIHFRSSNPRDRRIMENLCPPGREIPSYDSLLSLIHERPDVLYVSPSYVEIELTGSCDLDCIFCYRKLMPVPHSDCDPGIVRKLCSDMREFGIPYAICFGGSGEPMMNPGFNEILGIVASDPLVSTLVVETNGIYADSSYISQLLKFPAKKIITIVNINGYNSDSYTAIHRADYFDRVFENVVSLKESYPKPGSLYVQLMKIKETEPFIDRYYDFWEKQGIPIILQKQNTYIGRVPDRRYSDLSPLDRIPCWHLQRDLYMISDGRICFCKQDIDGKHTRGNIMQESASELFEKGRLFFINDYKKNLNSDPDCHSCDEWYTYNF